MAEAAILDGQFVKKIVTASCKDLCETIWPEFIQRFLSIVIFMFWLFLATAANSHLGLPSDINSKQLHLQIILIECD